MLGDVEQKKFTVRDVAAKDFIGMFAQHLKKNNLIDIPEWLTYVKTATRKSGDSGNELAPTDEDWVYFRVASLLRKIYLRPRSGVRLLSHLYGGNHRGKCRPERHDHASTKIIRWGLLQLEKLKFIRKDKNKDHFKVNSRYVGEDGRRNLNALVTSFVQSRKTV